MNEAKINQILFINFIYNLLIKTVRHLSEKQINKKGMNQLDKIMKALLPYYLLKENPTKDELEIIRIFATTYKIL